MGWGVIEGVIEYGLMDSSKIPSNCTKWIQMLSLPIAPVFKAFTGLMTFEMKMR